MSAYVCNSTSGSQDASTASLVNLCLKTGGNLRICGETLSSPSWMTRLYYFLYNDLHLQGGSRVSLRLRCNAELVNTKISSKWGFQEARMLTRPWISQEDYFIFHFELPYTIDLRKQAEIHFQAVCIFDDNFGRRFIRVFNHQLALAESPSSLSLT